MYRYTRRPVMKKKNKLQKLSYAETLLHISNPMHLEACKKGGSIQKSMKTYTRKTKYKKSFH